MVGASPDTDTRSDREQGIYRGRSIARRFISADNWIVLVGRRDADNDLLTFKLGRPFDFWMHAAGVSGSHVVVLNPDRATRLPRDTQELAASLAARYSKAKQGGQVAVHVARVDDVAKPRGAPPGKVAIRRYDTLHARPYRDEAPAG
jgi:predicted ribosome quality control (RQC) complex YloA/Tae2 family protein